MKKLIMCIFALALYSCYSFKIPRIYDVSVVDYKQYAKQGFFISETDYAGFEYDPIGSIIATVASGYTLISTNDFGGGMYSKNPSTYNVYDAIDAAVEKCEALGADGIIRLKISIEKRTSPEGKIIYDSKGSVFTVYTVTGMAIKRK